MTYSVTHLKNLKMGHEKLRETPPIGSLTIVHLAESGNKSKLLTIKVTTQ